MDFLERKLPRLLSYDYSSNGCYFITICTSNRINLFGCIENREILINEYGKIAEDELININNHFSCAAVDKYVIMPNHMHCIFALNDRFSKSTKGSNLTERSRPTEGSRPFRTYDKNPSLSTIIGLYKSCVSRRIHLLDSNLAVWQKSFYDHVIRAKTNTCRYGNTSMKIN